MVYRSVCVSSELHLQADGHTPFRFVQSNPPLENIEVRSEFNGQLITHFQYRLHRYREVYSRTYAP
jgi:hypothetical protein